MDDFTTPNYLFILLTSVEYDSCNEFSGIYSDPQKAVEEANLFCRGREESSCKIVRIDPTKHFEKYIPFMRRLPNGAEVVYTISGKILPE